MNADSTRARFEVQELARALLSRDPVLFNSTINSHFAAAARYEGHGLAIKGASNIKHAAWLLNSVDAAPGADVEVDDVEWDESSSTARITTTRYIRPRFFPLFTFAVPKVKTTLKFNTDSDAAQGPGQDSDQPTKGLLYVTSFEDAWPLDSTIRSLPLAGKLYQSLFTPLATMVVLFASNFLFVVFARARSTTTNVVEPTVQIYASRAKAHLPQGVTTNLDQGFERGTSLAREWGRSSVDTLSRLAHHPLRALEWTAQTSTSIANRILPVSLPTPYVFEPVRTNRTLTIPGDKVPLDEPLPTNAEKTLAEHDTHAKRTEFEQEKNPRGAAAEALRHPEPAKQEEAKPAAPPASEEPKPAPPSVAQVGATKTEPAKEINIPAQQHTEAPPAEAEKKKSHKLKKKPSQEKTLFDRIDVPDATSKEGGLLAPPKSGRTASVSSSSSGEEDTSQPKKQGSKKKRGGKKKRGNGGNGNGGGATAQHANPPTFTETL